MERVGGSVSHSNESDEYQLRRLILSHLREKTCSPHIICKLRSLDRGWRDAVNETFKSFYFATEHVFEGDSKLESLVHFPRLEALILEKESESPLRDNLDVLRAVSQLKSLALKGFAETDRMLLETIQHMSFLQELVLVESTEFTDEGLKTISEMPQLKSFSWITSKDVTHFADEVWSNFKCLEKLAVRLDGASSHLKMQGISKLPSLHSLMLTTSICPDDFRLLCGMQQLKMLSLPFPAVRKADLEYISQLKELTRLEFMTSVVEFPKWIKSFTKLRHLKITWSFSAEAGILTEDCLPSLLVCLSLNTFRGPVKDSVFGSLVRLKKLSVSYVCDVGAKDEASAFGSLCNVEELLICRMHFGCMASLPDIHQMHHLKKLYIEVNGAVSEDYVAKLPKSLKVLEHLTLVSEFSDKHLEYIAQISSLTSLSLQHSTCWSPYGFFKLRKLTKLKDLCMYHCGNLELCDGFEEDLFRWFESLVHLGMFPVVRCNANRIPTVYDDGLRLLRIDEDCKLNKHFN